MKTRRVSKEDLRSSVAARTRIGEAKGLLMERLDLDSDGAFTILRQLSNHTNRRLVEIAAELVETRRLPNGSPVTHEVQRVHRVRYGTTTRLQRLGTSTRLQRVGTT
jgi:ANTAR domain